MPDGIPRRPPHDLSPVHPTPRSPIVSSPASSVNIRRDPRPSPKTTQETEMRKPILATVLCLTALAAAPARAADWPPEKQKESVFTERKLDTYQHGVKD